MTTEERLKIYYEYCYLIDNELQKYSPNKNDMEQIMDAAISGLFQAIDSQEDNECIDFKTYVLFHIRSQINNILNIKD